MQGDIKPVKLTVVEGMLIERRSLSLSLPPAPVFRAFTGLGGERGWLYLNWSWEIRGWFDKLIGGVGLRRGRRHPDDIRVGEALDFWRVEAVEPDRLLRLRAEMKVPGRAWLEFQSLRQPDGGTLLTQTAYFAPRGVAGFLYWYAALPDPRLHFQRHDPQDRRTRQGARCRAACHAQRKWIAIMSAD